MARPSKPYSPGEGGKRLSVILPDDEAEQFEKIRRFIKKKFGEGAATDANTARAAILHFANHIDRGELE